MDALIAAILSGPTWPVIQSRLHYPGSVTKDTMTEDSFALLIPADREQDILTIKTTVR